MNPNYIEDFNGSDYVCMTRAAPQSATKFAPMLHTLAPPPPKKNLATSSPTAAAAISVKHAAISNSATIEPATSSTAKLPSYTTLPAPQSLATNTSTENVTSVSPTPSQLSTGSNKRELQHEWLFNDLNRSQQAFHVLAEKVLGKNLLPYNVTPPRPSGRSEAERKIEELTRQLEEEMERNEDQGEYFGICHTCGEKVTGAGQACQAMGNLYHTNCFICCSCGRALRGKAFYNVHGRVYCEEDYMVS